MLRQECIPSASKRNGRQQAREQSQMELGPWCLLGLWCLHRAGTAALEGVECSDVAHLISFLKNNFIYLFLAVLGFSCCTGFSVAVESGGYSSLPYAGFLLQWLLLLQRVGSIVAIPGL